MAHKNRPQKWIGYFFLSLFYSLIGVWIVTRLRQQRRATPYSEIKVEPIVLPQEEIDLEPDLMEQQAEAVLSASGPIEIDTAVEETRQDLTTPSQPVGDQEPDDLEIIEGIGPKIASIMNAAGIYRFEQLANAELDTLQEILRNANIRLANPTTWPQQARIAAEGKFDELLKYQKTLKAGRP